MKTAIELRFGDRIKGNTVQSVQVLEGFRVRVTFQEIGEEPLEARTWDTFEVVPEELIFEVRHDVTDWVCSITEEWDVADDYGEPGYELPEGDLSMVIKLDMNGLEEHGDTFKALERRGVEFVWIDEWEMVDNLAYRTVEDSYSWEPSLVWDTDEGDWLARHHGVENWIEWANCNSDRALPPWAELPEEWEAWEGVKESGLHAGQTDKPADVVSAIRDAHGYAVDYVFQIVRRGQFDVHFQAYVKGV